MLQEKENRGPIVKCWLGQMLNSLVMVDLSRQKLKADCVNPGTWPWVAMVKSLSAGQSLGRIIHAKCLQFSTSRSRDTLSLWILPESLTHGIGEHNKVVALLTPLSLGVVRVAAIVRGTLQLIARPPASDQYKRTSQLKCLGWIAHSSSESWSEEHPVISCCGLKPEE